MSSDECLSDLGPVILLHIRAVMPLALYKQLRRRQQSECELSRQRMLRVLRCIVEVIEIQSDQHTVPLTRLEKEFDYGFEDVLSEPLNDASEGKHLKTTN